jgi:adenine-specific DNA-methyltransferase
LLFRRKTLTTSQHTISLFYQKNLARVLILKRPAHELKKLNQALASSAVDLNPHQIDAALFAFNCSLSRGAILLTVITLQSLFLSLLPFQRVRGIKAEKKELCDRVINVIIYKKTRRNKYLRCLS